MVRLLLSNNTIDLNIFNIFNILFFKYNFHNQ